MLDFRSLYCRPHVLYFYSVLPQEMLHPNVIFFTCLLILVSLPVCNRLYDHPSC